MAENSKIEWTDHTFNPWIGCTKVSPACDHCYAESWAKRTGGADLWQGKRRRTSPSNWKKPLKWNAEAAKLGIRYRVFCASLADVFDNEVPEEWRFDLYELIEDTPHLDWLLLTKRIGNAKDFTYGVLDGFPNVWLGATVVNQREADRDVPKLLETPARVRFLSCEPLLEPLNLSDWLVCSECADTRGGTRPPVGEKEVVHCRNPRLDWVIVGGESGANARPMEGAWAAHMARQCAWAGVPFFFKQGSQANWHDFKNIDAFPVDLQVREYPR